METLSWAEQEFAYADLGDQHVVFCSFAASRAVLNLNSGP